MKKIAIISIAGMILFSIILYVVPAVGEENNIVVDNDVKNGWYLHGDIGLSFTPEQHTTMQQQAYKLYHENTYARAIVRNLVKFVLGKGPRIIPVDDDNKTKLLDIWKDFKKQNKFNLREKEIATRLFRDGEVFLRFYIDATEGNNRHH